MSSQIFQEYERVPELWIKNPEGTTGEFRRAGVGGAAGFPPIFLFSLQEWKEDPLTLLLLGCFGMSALGQSCHQVPVWWHRLIGSVAIPTGGALNFPQAFNPVRTTFGSVPWKCRLVGKTSSKINPESRSGGPEHENDKELLEQVQRRAQRCSAWRKEKLQGDLGALSSG